VKEKSHCTPTAEHKLECENTRTPRIQCQQFASACNFVNHLYSWREIWANAHETRDSFSLISYADCIGLSPVISAKIHSNCASQPKIAKNSLKPLFLGVQGRSRSSILVPLESSSAVLVMIRSKSCLSATILVLD